MSIIDYATVAAWISFFVLLIIIYHQYVAQIIYDWRIEGTELHLCLFRLLPIYKVSMYDLTFARYLTDDPYKLVPVALATGNRIWGSRIIKLKKRKGIIRSITLTPANPAEFLAAIYQVNPTLAGPS